MLRLSRLVASIALSFSLFLSTSAHAVIKIGTYFFDPPLVFALNQGFYIDLIHALCKGLEEECQIIPMDFNQFFVSLDNKTIDLAFGVSISSTREKNYIFSLPFMLAQGQFLTATNKNITSIDQLKGQKIGTIKEESTEGIFYAYLLSTYNNLFTITLFDDVEDIITALDNGDISAAFIHHSSAQYWQQNSSNSLSLLGAPVTLGEGSSAMALPENAALIDKVNQQLQLLESNGTYLTIFKTYFGS